MNPLTIIKKYYDPQSDLYRLLVVHGSVVAKKALSIAKNVPELKPNRQFIKEAAMLHDIGIIKTHAPGIFCNGTKPYICHGHEGRKILEKEGLHVHALVCERHTGVGLTKEDIVRHKLPLPKRDMIPISIEEKIICLADKFYSKGHPKKEKSMTEIRKELKKFGKEKIDVFDGMIKKLKLI